MYQVRATSYDNQFKERVDLYGDLARRAKESGGQGVTAIAPTSINELASKQSLLGDAWEGQPLNDDQFEEMRAQNQDWTGLFNGIGRLVGLSATNIAGGVATVAGLP
jgi:hypothetical protein